MIWKLMSSKNISNKKNVLLTWYVFFNEKKMRKIPITFESQILALFDISLLRQFSKFNNFLWVCWFLDKTLSNFVSHVWKLHNTYCHKLITPAYLGVRITRIGAWPSFLIWSPLWYCVVSALLQSSNIVLYLIYLLQLIRATNFTKHEFEFHQFE
jgi:hypothetical protein